MSEYSGVEAADINDRDILDATRQERNANGWVKFKYRLPDGEDLTSEWIDPDHQRKAIMAWCEAVRGAIVQRAKEKASRRARTKIAIPEDEVPVAIRAPEPKAAELPPVFESNHELAEPKKPVVVGKSPAPPVAVRDPAIVPAVSELARSTAASGVDADEFVAARILYHETQLVKWRKVQAALFDT